MLGEVEARLLEEGLPVWQIGPMGLGRWLTGGGAAYHAGRRRLLSLILEAAQRPFLAYSEDPHADGPGGVWERIGEHWVIPAHRDCQALYEWLALGDWLLYCADGPVGEEVMRRLGSMQPAEMLAAMREASVRCVVDSYHGNDPWTVAFHPEVSLAAPSPPEDGPEAG